MRALVLYHRDTNRNYLQTASKDYDECYKRSVSFILDYPCTEDPDIKEAPQGEESSGALENFYMRWIDLPNADFQKYTEDVISYAEKESRFQELLSLLKVPYMKLLCFFVLLLYSGLFWVIYRIFILKR
jgi:hypothetical protein